MSNERKVYYSGIGLTQTHKRVTATSGKTLNLLLTDVPEIFSGTEVVAAVSDHDILLADLK